MDYDALARDYGVHRRPDSDVLAVLASIAAGYESPRLLEIGAGTGNFAAALTAIGAGIVIGIDPSRQMLNQVQGDVIGRIAQARAEQLPFADRMFSVVYSVDVIHHVLDRVAAATEAFRVLRPGGTSVTVTDSEADLLRRIPLSRYFPETVEAERKRYPPIGTLQDENMQAGFVDAEVQHVLSRGALTDIHPYRDKAYSSLLLIPDEAFDLGIARLEEDLKKGPIKTWAPYTLVIARRPLD